MYRRTIIKQLGLISGMTVLPATLFIGCKSENYALLFLTKSEFNLINELSEVILPDTQKSPGAKTAKVANFIDSYIFNCYDDINKSDFQKQLLSLDNLSNSTFNVSFSELSNEQRQKFVSSLESELNTAYTKCKTLILFGYYTSEVGMTQALRYIPVPGKFDGNVTYSKGDGAWAL